MHTHTHKKLSQLVADTTKLPLSVFKFKKKTNLCDRDSKLVVVKYVWSNGIIVDCVVVDAHSIDGKTFSVPRLSTSLPRTLTDKGKST